MTTLSLADARAGFSRMVDSASSTHERFEVTRNGARVAVLLGADDYDALIDTLSILGDPDTMVALQTGLEELRTGDSVGADAVRAAMREAGRLMR